MNGALLIASLAAALLGSCAAEPSRTHNDAREAPAQPLLALAAPSDACKDAMAMHQPPAHFVRSVAAYAAIIGDTPDPEIMEAMRSVPRHAFVPPALRGRAYDDRPLPIGHDQTISQPSLVALMTHLLRPGAGNVMLEVGTGSGYQAAILSRLVARVYSIEIVEPLAHEAQERLKKLGYGNVEVKHGDGYLGWPEHAPFDGIIVTAGAPHVPRTLLEQLKPGGRMVIPVGPAYATQQLKLITRRADGAVAEERIIPVAFVPLTREGRKE